VVLLHGVAASARDWDALLPELVHAGYRAYAPDLVGHGNSTKPGEPSKYDAESIYHYFEDGSPGLGS